LPFLVLISAAALLSSLVFDLAAWVFAALLLLLPAALFGWLRYRDAGWTLEADRLVVRSRFLGRTTAIAPRRRLQSRTTLRSPFQRRVSLATFEAQVASGGGGAELRVTDLGADAADALIENLGRGA
jgi:putative membrane protein